MVKKKTNKVKVDKVKAAKTHTKPRKPSKKYPYAERLLKIFSGKSNQYVTDVSGCKYASVATYMNGKQRPSVEFLTAILQKGYDVDYILTGQSTAPKAEKITAGAAPKSADALLNVVLEQWKKLDNDGKVQVLVAALAK